MCLHIITHIKHAYNYIYLNANTQIRDTEHTFLHTWIHKHNAHHHLTFLLPLTYFTRDKGNCGVGTVEKNKNKGRLWLSHLPAAFVLLFFGRMPSWYRQTNRKASTDLNELRAVNMPTKWMMMMIVIKMMFTADRKTKDNQRTSVSAVFIGRCWPTSHTPRQRLTKTTKHCFHHGHHHLLTCLQRLSARYHHP